MKLSNTILTIIRLLVYGCLMAGLNMIFMYDASHPSGENKFGEGSLTEITQETFLFISACLILWAGLIEKNIRAFANLLALFFFASFIREFNNQFENWFYAVLVVLAGAAFLIIRDIKKFWPAVENFFSNAASAFFLIGFITTYIFSRLFGRTAFWKIIMGESYIRDPKNAGEECIELLGYSLLLISAIEILVAVFRQKKKT